MFTAGRILRKKDGAGTIVGERWESTDDNPERRKFRCYVPFVRPSLLATVAGFVVLATGVSFCIAGFYTGHQSQQQQQQPSEVPEDNNDTELSEARYLVAAGAAAAAGSMTSQHQQTPFISLTYVGSVIMSFGCFALIFAFVVFCEARDHAIDLYLRSKVYASSTRGPHHCRLPFRHDVIDVILTATRRRADRGARRGWSRSSLAAIVPRPSSGEAASAVERGSGTVEDGCFKIDGRPTLTSVSVGVDRTTDWLLSNGMHTESTSSSCLNPSHPDSFQPSQLDFKQSLINRSSKWSLGNGMLHTVSSTCQDKSKSDSVHINHVDFEHATVNRFSKLLFDNGMLYSESLHDRTSAGRPDKLDSGRQKHLDLGQDRSSDWSLSNGMLRQLSPERDGKISAGNSDHVADSNQDEMSVHDVGWKEDWKSAEVARLVTADVPNDGDTALENVELEATSVTYAEQSPVASVSRSSSSSSSSASMLFDVLIFSELVDDREMMTTKLESNEDTRKAVDNAFASESSPEPPQIAPNSRCSSTSESTDLGDRSSPSAGSNDGGRRPTRSCRLPSADRGTPTPTTERAGGGWKRGDGKREQETARRSHAGIHCPPPLPPPPTSPTVVATSGRPPRRHR